MNVPKRGIGATSLDKMANYARNNDLSLYQAIEEIDFIGISPKTTNAAAKFQQLIKGYTQQQEYLSVTELVEEILDKSGYREMLKAEKSLEAESRLENIEEFFLSQKVLKMQTTIRSLSRS